MWTPQSRTINYNLSPEMSMFVVAPATSFHHQQHHHHDPSSLMSPDLNGSNHSATALNVGVIPLLTATSCLADANQTGGGIQFWQHQHQQQQASQNLNYFKNCPNPFNNTGGGGGGEGVYGSSAMAMTSSSSATTTCEDCGNQAKKDCSHNRCRTCCKSRGYDCNTHVKSTWVPAARRRERQLMSNTVTIAATSGSTSGAKKPRLVTEQQQTNTTTSHTSTSNTTPPRSFEITSSHQDGSFKEALPGQVRAPATFKCVRVTAVDDGADEYAYQAVVQIGGHVFKGFLYDQGGETRDAFPNMSELHLGGGRNGASSPILDPSDVYAAAGGGSLLGGSGPGSGYGNQIN